jgi:hypothetical protein
MFAQVIQGRVGDAEALKAAVAEWLREQAPEATGWLGTTAGVADDGTFIAVARFDSAEAARRNSERPGQADWWTRTSRHFAGDVTFHDCDEVLTLQDGGSDDAGFVQVIQGHGNADAMRKMVAEGPSEEMRQYRPDVIGGTIALHGDGGFTQVVYFTSEEAAREGERKERPQEAQAKMAEAFDPAGLTFIDLRDPMFSSPG